MKKYYSVVCLLLLVSFVGQAQNKITVQKFKSKIDVFINNNFFTSYHLSEDEKYPFFFPVNGPSNATVTSMRNGVYPHHSSLFFGCDKVNGGNYWQEGLERGQIVSVRADVVETGDKVIIDNECIWVRPNALAPIKDIRKITISAPGKDLFQIDFDVKLEMLMDVVIEKTNHSLFSGRMDTDLSVLSGGTMINSNGEKGEKETFGKKAAWIDFYGKRGDKMEGMAILQHPTNEWYPAPWFTRDYGFFSPTPMYWPANDKETTLKKGQSIQLRYRVLVHSGDTNAAKIAELFEQYKSE